MPTSVKGLLPRLGLPRFVLSLLPLIVLSLSGNPSSAQAPKPLASQLGPGSVTEVITPAATVLSTAHYQVQLTLNCNSTSCTGDFPDVGRRRRLNVTRITCEISGAGGATFLEGYIRLINADGLPSLYQFLPVDYSLPSFSVHLLNRAVDMQAVAHQHMRVGLSLVGGTAFGAICSIAGTLDTLG